MALTLKKAREIVLDSWEVVKDTPKEGWGIGIQCSVDHKKCYIGYYAHFRYGDACANIQTKPGEYLLEASKMLLEYLFGDYFNTHLITNITVINDYQNDYFSQSHPKDRCEAFINIVRELNFDELEKTINKIEKELNKAEEFKTEYAL